jgi:hypothetical protein
MQVKEYVQALVDDGKLRVEKIGSGNWYWCFGSEETKAKEKVLEDLRKENGKIEKGLGELESKINETKGAMERYEDGENDILLVRLGVLETEVGTLKKEQLAYEEKGVRGLEGMKGDVRDWKGEAEMWTDDLGILEGYLFKLTGDKEVVQQVVRGVYEAVEGEWEEEGWLRELF